MSLVLVTGATGEVAHGVLPFLEQEFDLRLLDLYPPGNDPRRVQVDLLDWDALTRAMNGVDAVLHLAVASGQSGTYEEDAFNDLRFDVNVKGTYHVFEIARRVRVRRVVHVSSIMVVWGHGIRYHNQRNALLVPGDAKPYPVGTYALTKALAEDIARHYALPRDINLAVRNYVINMIGPNPMRPTMPDPMARHLLEVITVRIAAPLDISDPQLRNKPVRPQQVPFPDLAQAFIKALKVPLKRYEVVTIVGDSSERLWDLGQAEVVLGYKPTYYLDDLGVTFCHPFKSQQT